MKRSTTPLAIALALAVLFVLPTHSYVSAASGPLEGSWQVMDVGGMPIVAKIPVVMKEGANEVYAFRIGGNLLSLTQQRNARGVTVQNANTIRLMRVD